MTDINRHNQLSWDQQSAAGQSPWVQPVTTDAVNAARAGDWQIILTPTKSVPKSWFGDLKDKDLLCLASGGGQQAPILAAAGAVVTSFDQSPEQLRTVTATRRAPAQWLYESGLFSIRPLGYRRRRPVRS